MEMNYCELQHGGDGSVIREFGYGASRPPRSHHSSHLERYFVLMLCWCF